MFYKNYALIFLLLVIISIHGCRKPYYKQEYINYKSNIAIDRIGNTGAATIIQSNVMIINPELEHQIQLLADKLLSVTDCDAKLKIHVINSEHANLLSFPNGDIFIFSGFLDLIENRDELAFAIGHEICHVCSKHSWKRLKKRLKIQRFGSKITAFIGGLVYAATSGVISGMLSNVVKDPFTQALEKFSQSLAKIAARVPEKLSHYIIASMIHSYSRSQEVEADKFGLVYMKKTGYNEKSAVSALEKLTKIWHPK